MSLLLLYLPTTAGPQSYSYDMVGGGVSGGTAEILQKAIFSFVGGGIAGGSAIVNQLISFSMTSGAVAGGIASVVGTISQVESGSSPSIIITQVGRMARAGNNFYIKI